ncbi:MAG TPA: helix-turn-helix domain-containing protein [Pseudonocardia sp.]|nr:helix-turn-helix domain-containing protein [Pseudonocardia sp.]
MNDAVKPRAARTRATRRRIVDAATELFVTSGYGSTTLEQVAARAGVAVQTVYFHFGNKRNLLKEAVDVAAVGDDEPVALLDRDWLAQARAERDPRRVLALWVSAGREILGRVGSIMGAVREAAATDPEMAAQWTTNEEQRASAFRVLVEQLDGLGALRVPVDEAVDVVCALQSLELHGILTARGWTPQRWERFVVESLDHALLVPAVRPPADPITDRRTTDESDRGRVAGG